jgi:hypothetical protein
MWSNFFQTLYMSGKDCSGLFWTLDVVTTDDPVTNFETFQTDRAGCHYLETEQFRVRPRFFGKPNSKFRFRVTDRKNRNRINP